MRGKRGIYVWRRPQRNFPSPWKGGSYAFGTGYAIQDMLLRIRDPRATTALAAMCGFGGCLIASDPVPTNRERRPLRRRAKGEASQAMARKDERGGHAPHRPERLRRVPRAAGVCRLTTRCGDSPLSSLSPLSSASLPPSVLRPISLRLQMVKGAVAR